MLPSPNPRFPLTTNREIAIVTACYIGSGIVAGVLFRFVEHARGVPDPHREIVTLVFAALCAIAWTWSVTSILRRRL